MPVYRSKSEGQISLLLFTEVVDPPPIFSSVYCYTSLDGLWETLGDMFMTPYYPKGFLSQ